MIQTADLIHKMAEFFASEEFFEKGENARLELSPDDVRCMYEVIKACEDAISRQAVLDCQHFIYDETGEELEVILAENVLNLPSVTPQPCEDAISRQSAIYLAGGLKQDLPDDERIADMVMAHNEGILEYQTQLSLLPSVSPQQRTGWWIKQNYGWNWQCSECGFVTLPSAKEIFTFCPKCGVKMEVEE